VCVRDHIHSARVCVVMNQASKQANYQVSVWVWMDIEQQPIHYYLVRIQGVQQIGVSVSK